MENRSARLEVDACVQLLLIAQAKLQRLGTLSWNDPAVKTLGREIDSLVARVRRGMAWQEAVHLALTERLGAEPPECSDYTEADAARADDLMAFYDRSLQQ